jgi:hypothetical protein
VRPERTRAAVEAAIAELDRIRAPLMEELGRLQRAPDYLQGQMPDACCRRPLNRMRISPLEALAIERAFRRDPKLRAKLPAVIERLKAELPRLRDDEERQPFDCPLLEQGRCLVHHAAKPIGCTAWHPPAKDQEGEWSFTAKGWEAFADRDAVCDGVFGSKWKLRVIPLWLKSVFDSQVTASPAAKTSETETSNPGSSADAAASPRLKIPSVR